jgi:hypothetical protein
MLGYFMFHWHVWHWHVTHWLARDAGSRGQGVGGSYMTSVDQMVKSRRL